MYLQRFLILNKAAVKVKSRRAEYGLENLKRIVKIVIYQDKGYQNSKTESEDITNSRNIRQQAIIP